jgi:retron-type reverse transcriptase
MIDTSKKNQNLKQKEKMNSLRLKKKLTKKEKSFLIKQSRELITNLGKRLEAHTQRNLNTNHINGKIFHLFRDPFLFVNAYTKISKNKGALTEGYKDSGTMKYFGIAKANQLARKVTEESYEFSPVKRTWIPKPGKNKKRPLDVPTQSDRIVQEAVRGILEAIYEPVFIEQGLLTNGLSNNYGFRPKNSTWTAMERIKKHARRCNLVIEGDIVSAYNNVDHAILLKILRKRIKDKKFLRIIKRMLKSGIMDQRNYEHSLVGTPQGGIISPLLFNIYLLEFDQYVYNEFIVPILEENEKKPKREMTTTKYNQISHLTNVARKKLNLEKNKSNPDPVLVKELTRDFRKKRLSRLNTGYTDATRLRKGAVYVRYADDWVLAITATMEQAAQIKRKITEFLKDTRKIELDQGKTKISYVSQGYKFLGFEIRLSVNHSRIKRVLIKQSGKYERILRRTTSRQLTIEPDSKRLLNRLKYLNFCRKDGFPIGKPPWRVYDEFAIVQKYSQIFRGIFNYYQPCERLTRLAHVSFILQYSCAKTIAGKKKISLREVFNRYGKNLRIQIKIKTTKSENVRTIEFLDLTTLRRMAKNKTNCYQNQVPEMHDPFRIQEHWRTKFKFYNECCICGEQEEIALHHINNVRSIKNKDRYEAIRMQINRVQIPVCSSCHNDITNGKYSDPKSPIEFYNEFLAKL